MPNYTGGTGDDTFAGDGTNESIVGNAGNDTLYGGGGQDTVNGSAGNDVLYGDDGNDRIDGGTNNDRIDGGLGNDSIVGGAGDDTIFLGDGFGVDTIVATDTTETTGDVLDASALTSNVVMTFGTTGENGTLVSGSNTATYSNVENYFLGSGNDSVTSTASTAAIDMDLGAGNDTILTSSGADTIVGGFGDDSLNAGAGNNTVSGGDGSDTILATTGNDTIAAGAGNDSISVGDGANRVLGEDGNDTILTGTGADSIGGGLGNDQITAGSGNNTVTGDDGDDTIIATAGADNLSGGIGNDLIFGGDGVNTLSGGDGADTIIGGANTDILTGGTGNDQLDGGAGTNTLSGEAGDDRIQGGAGNENLSGGDGADTFFVGNSMGTDTINGGGVDDGTGDVLDASAVTNNTTLTYSSAEAGNFVNGATANFAEIERILLGGGADTVNASAATTGINLDTDSGADSVLGGSGGDLLYTGDGADSIDGGAGNDTIYGDATHTVELISGGAFTSGTTGWTINNPTGGAGPANLGAGTVSFNNSDEAVYGDSIQQSIATVAGQTYTAGFTALENDAGTGTHTVVVDVLDASNTVIYSQTYVVADSTTAKYSFSFTSPTNGATLRFTNTGATNTVGTDLKIDDVSVRGPGNGTGADTIVGGLGDDLVYAGAGNDSLDGSAGNDTIFGGDGDDYWTFDIGGDELAYGGAGNDSLSGDVGNDTLYGDDGNDVMEGHIGSDQLYGGLGDDYIAGGDVTSIYTAANRTLTPVTANEDNLADYLDGGAGNDTLLGNGGADTLAGGAGNDYLIGGAGADSFVAQGADTITDFDATTGVSGNGNLDNDFVDLTSFYNKPNLAVWNAANPSNQFDNPLKWLQADQADGILQSAGGLRILNGGAPISGALLNDENTAVCFVAGTRIDTEKGHRPVEKLRIGDLVQTADHGMQPIRWIGRQVVNGMGDLAPICIAAGAMGNKRDLFVSPQHRMMLSGWQVELLFGEDEVLAAAKMLVNGGTIAPLPVVQVSYYHILFDAHEIVFAEGVPSESFHPGEQGFDALGTAMRAEIAALFPEMALGDFAAYGPSARRSLRSHEARLLQMGRNILRTVQSPYAPRKAAIAAK